MLMDRLEVWTMHKSYLLYFYFSTLNKALDQSICDYKFYEFLDFNFGILDVDLCPDEKYIKLFEQKNKIRQFYVSQRIFENFIKYSMKKDSKIELIDIEFYKQDSISIEDFQGVVDSLNKEFFLDMKDELQQYYGVDIKMIKFLYKDKEIEVFESGRILIESPDNVIENLTTDIEICQLLSGYSV